MASYLKASIKRAYAENFLAELERNSNQYFFFVAKSTEWADEPNPDTYIDSVKSENTVLNNIVAYKKIDPSNILFALPKYDWVYGSVYDQYDDAVDLFSEDDPKQFYVVTDENNIYKCLFNNNDSESTVKPTQVISAPFYTDDGYQWQYLATVRESDLPFELTDYVPVDVATTSTDTETVNQYNTQVQAISGSLTRIGLVNGLTTGVYEYTISRSGSSAVTLRVTGYAKNTDGTHRLVFSDRDSYGSGKLNVNQLPNYIGYAIRVDASTQNRAEINNYGIITGYDYDSTTQIVSFTVKDDVIPFAATPGSGLNYTSVEIIPAVRVYGDGTGAYAFSVMDANKHITDILLVSGGRNYSKAEANIITSVKANTNHPILTPAISPKGGHGKNILKELNVRDILLVVRISEEDTRRFIGGSYRQFGIIKNPLLSDGSGIVAGSTDPYYRDIMLRYVGSNPSDYIKESILRGLAGGDSQNLLIGSETLASSKINSVKSTNLIGDGDTRFIVKTYTYGAGGMYKTYADRPNDYVLSMQSPFPVYAVGETVKQVIPALTDFGNGVSFGYDIVSKGIVTSVGSGSTVGVTVIENSFVAGTVAGLTLSGLVSGATGYIQSLSPRYGESVYVSVMSGGSLGFYRESGNTDLFSVVEVGPSYFERDVTPMYSGLYALDISTGGTGSTGGMTTTSSVLTPTSFSSGDFVEQGVSANYTSDYASGTVYYWDFQNAFHGVLYLTDVLGKFKSASVNGINGTTLGAYVVSSVTLPEIDKTSGEVLYIDSMRPVNRTTAQKEEFRIRLGF